MKDKDTVYKFLPVKESTHKKFKTLCAKEGKTFDKMLLELVRFKKHHDNKNKE